ncbi:replicative DNA helicase (plasmid) [Methylomarinum sp. Ch1-1]|uniref:Replicative DNA helicase n=1 Tax=Methylomarinum roseum TaxID=3067653 RepID=A0AAU7P1D7_9GAMM|nr:replicative DNA helicase [Methylomarinum sp. Ch1-1]MDP4523292.1 replicative DNA helicase [Methylomarinum sp. Ch1-1]
MKKTVISDPIYQDNALRADDPDSFVKMDNDPLIFNLQAEKSVIGGLIIKPGSWDDIASIVQSDDFYVSEHKAVFTVISRMVDESKEVDILTVSNELEGSNISFNFLGELAKDTPSAANIKAYAKIVKDQSDYRKLMQAVGKIKQNASLKTPDYNIDHHLNDAERLINQIIDGRSNGKNKFSGLTNVLPKVLDKIEEMFESEGGLVGYSSGFTDLDDITSGIVPSDLIIVAARPSMGKTSFSMNIGENIAQSTGLPIAVFSMEMPEEQLGLRMLASQGRIPLNHLRSGKMTDSDWPKLTAGITRLKTMDINIDDTPALSPNEMKAKVKQLVREKGKLGAVIVDYIQLMRGNNEKESRINQLSEISRSLKSIAKEFDVPVIALSQLNRNLEQRPNKRPVMSDLRESGAIEQDADVIMFVYRDEVYNEDSPDKGTSEIIIGKQRNGPLGTARLTFAGEYTRFGNFINQSYDVD